MKTESSYVLVDKYGHMSQTSRPARVFLSGLAGENVDAAEMTSGLGKTVITSVVVGLILWQVFLK